MKYFVLQLAISGKDGRINKTLDNYEMRTSYRLLILGNLGQAIEASFLNLYDTYYHTK